MAKGKTSDSKTKKAAAAKATMKDAREKATIAAKVEAKTPAIAKAKIAGGDAAPKSEPKLPKGKAAKLETQEAAGFDVEHATAPAAKGKPERRATAETMAGRQREISVSEFFTKNRHLLGFDNPAKSLLTTIKEAVDNSLDACEEAGILPDITVEIQEVSEGRFRAVIEDNGPGIVKAQMAKIFAKLLYGSKFHRLKQSRGQQGIGISAAGLYGQLTTGKPVIITSKTGKGRPTHRIELRIDTKRNQPDVVKDEIVDWDREHGTRVEINLVAAYRGGRTGIEAYLEQTVVANPHMALTFIPPKGEKVEYPRVSQDLPREAQEIKPHPHGVELGMFLNMLHDSEKKTVKQVLSDDFSRVSPAIAEQICKIAKVPSKTLAIKIHGEAVDALHKALGEVRVMAPSASCVVPIGEDLLVAGLKRRFKADFYVSTTRPPSVYRGNPFVVEAGLAYGGNLPVDEPADVMRFANRVPLQYQPKSCAISEAVYETNWKAYEMQQPRGSLPVGPIAIVVHLASVWVPFTSEAKEAVAHYDDLLRELRLALQECGRKLAAHIRAKNKAESEQKRMSLFQKYIPEVSKAIGVILARDAKGIEKSFFKALPNFVKLQLPAGDDTPGGGTPPPASDGGSGASTPKASRAKGAPKGTKAPKGSTPAATAAPASADKASPKVASKLTGKPAKTSRKAAQTELSL